MHLVGRRSFVALASSALVGSPNAGILPITAQPGTFILFATDPGGTALDGPPGGNSPFSRAFATALLASRDADLDTIARQVMREVRAATEGRQRPQATSTLEEALRPGRERLRAVAAGVSRYDWLPVPSATHALSRGPEATGRLAGLPQTPNAGSDAILVSAAIRAVGGDLVGGQPLIDPARADILAAVRQLAQGTPNQPRLFFFAGNGIEVDGHALLLARDTPLAQSVAQLDGGMLRLQEVLDILKTGGAPIIIVLDICRDDPFRTASERTR